MKIKKIILKNYLIQQLLGFFACAYIYFVRYTSKIKYENQSIPEKFWKNKKPFILAFWHNQLMMISFSWLIKKRVNILASGHSDGRFGAIVGKYFNLRNIAVSKKNKNLILRTILNILNENSYIGITPDGPRGPKEQVSEGIIRIAKKSNIPIIPVGFWSSKNFKLNSWDSFLITLPFSKCSFVWNDPIEIPEDLNDDQISNFQKILKEKIDQSIKRAKENCK